MTKLIKFIFGWTIWIIVFILSILFNLVTWNWKETWTLDMEVVITEICGKSTWEIMT
jgi:hypothetical protein